MNRYEELELRTQHFAARVIALCRKLPQDTAIRELIRQLVRACGSVGSNYIEANESLGHRDFLMHVRISRKEAKESRFWLRLPPCEGDDAKERDLLVVEATEFIKIFTAIIRKSE